MDWKEVKENNMKPPLDVPLHHLPGKTRLNTNKPRLKHGNSQIRRSVDRVLFFSIKQYLPLQNFLLFLQ